MFVYRVENHKGHGPVYGKKHVYYEPYDLRGTNLGNNMKKMHPGKSDEELKLYGMEPVEVNYNSRECIINHKTPRENKPYFHNRYGNGSGYYRFNEKYFFGYTTFKKAYNYIIPGKKNSMTLQRDGFYIAIYKVNNGIIFPDGQIAFKRDKAKLVRRCKNIYSKKS